MKGLKEYIQNVETTKESVSEQDVRKAVLNYLQNSPAYKSYYNTLGDIEVYKMQKALGTEDLNNPQATTAILGTIKTYASKVDPMIILNQMGVNIKEFNKLPDADKNPNAPQTKQSVYAAAVDLFTQQMYSQNQQLGGDNTTMLKEMTAYSEADKIANLYSNVVGYTSIAQKYDLKSNTLWGKRYDENSKRMPFSVSGTNLDIGDYSDLNKAYKQNLSDMQTFDRQLKNLKAGNDSILNNLKAALDNAKLSGDVNKIEDLKKQYDNQAEVVKRNIKDLEAKKAAIESQKATFEAMRNNAMNQLNLNVPTQKGTANVAITNEAVLSNDKLIKAFGENPAFDNLEVVKKASEVMENALSKDLPYSDIKAELDSIVSTNMSNLPIIYRASFPHLIEQAYNKMVQNKQNNIDSKIEDFQGSGGKLSVPIQLMSMQGNPVYDSYTDGIANSLSTGQPWKILGNNDYQMANDEDFIDEVLKKSSSRKVMLARTTNNPDGNVMANVTYYDKDNKPITTVMVEVPNSESMNTGMTKALLTETMNNAFYAPGGDLESVGDGTRNVLTATQVASMVYYDPSDVKNANGGKTPAGTLGELFTKIDNSTGVIDKDIIINETDGKATHLKIHVDADGATATLSGGKYGNHMELKPFNKDKHEFATVGDMMPVLYNTLIYKYADNQQ